MNPSSLPASFSGKVKSALAGKLLDPLLNFFSKERPLRQLLLITLLLSTAYTLNIFSPDFLLGKSAYWNNLAGDQATPWIGYQYYIRDVWRFPLFYTVKLGTPEGTNIIFTDSIPLVALLGKFIYKIFDVELNLYGLWTGLCYVLQGVSMVLLLSAMGQRNLAVVAGALLALSLPAFLFRIGHPALLGHFLILAALTLYVRVYHSHCTRPLLVSFALLLAVSLLVHPYLFLMNLSIFTAALAHTFYTRELSQSRAATYLAVMLLFLLCLMLVSGHIGAHSPRNISPGEFGLFALNLASPVFPIESSLFPHLTADAWKDKGFTAEGYNYLGFGIVLLLLVHVLVSRARIAAAFHEHRALKWTLIGLTLFALSNQIYYRHELLFYYALPKFLEAAAGGFRASGRFFWPVAYVVMAGLIVLTLRCFRPGIAIILLTAVLVVQWFDTTQLRFNVVEKIRGSDQAWLANKSAWEDLLRQHRAVRFYPSYMCAVPADNNDAFLAVQNFNLQIQLLTAQANIPVNSAYLARQNKDCAGENRELADLHFAPDTLYFFLDNSKYFLRNSVDFDELHRMIDSSPWCHRFDFGYACTQNWRYF